MLPIPTGSSLFNIVGIDPGSDTVGICIMTICSVSGLIVDTSAHTVHGSRLFGSEWLTENYGDRFKRIAVLKEYLTRIFFQSMPISIAIEAPFFNHLRPQAFGVLMEVMAGIRESISNYDIWVVPYLIDPSSVKNAVGASGNAKKEVIRDRILNLTTLNSSQNLSLLDEHSLDAIAVAYARYKRMFRS